MNLSVTMNTFAAVVGLLSCATLLSAAISGLGLGAITLVMSIICFAHCFNSKDPTVQCLCCSAVSFLTLTFLAALIANTVFVALDIKIIYDPAGPCLSTELAPAVMGLAYFLLVIFGLFSVRSTYICCKREYSAADNGVNYVL